MKVTATSKDDVKADDSTNIKDVGARTDQQTSKDSR